MNYKFVALLRFFGFVLSLVPSFQRICWIRDALLTLETNVKPEFTVILIGIGIFFYFLFFLLCSHIYYMG
jgi:hypothetical protein